MHVRAPANPVDGEVLRCWCGTAYVFVVLDDGRPGEWVTASW